MASTRRSTTVRSRSESRRSLIPRRDPSSSARGAPRPRLVDDRVRTGRSTYPGEHVLHRELQCTGDAFEDVGTGVGKQTNGADGLFAAGLEVPPQRFGDFGPSGGVPASQAALFALLGEPPAELDPLLRFVHAASVPVPGLRVQPVNDIANDALGRRLRPRWRPRAATCGDRSEASTRARARPGGDWPGPSPTGPAPRSPTRHRSRDRPRPHPAHRSGCSSCRPGTRARCR